MKWCKMSILNLDLIISSWKRQSEMWVSDCQFSVLLSISVQQLINIALFRPYVVGMPARF